MAVHNFSTTNNNIATIKNPGNSNSASVAAVTNEVRLGQGHNFIEGSGIGLEISTLNLPNDYQVMVDESPANAMTLTGPNLSQTSLSLTKLRSGDSNGFILDHRGFWVESVNYTRVSNYQRPNVTSSVGVDGSATDPDFATKFVGSPNQVQTG